MAGSRTVSIVEKAIKSVQRNIDRLKKVEAKARAAWTKRYHEYQESVTRKDAIANEFRDRAKTRRIIPKKLDQQFDRLSKLVDGWAKQSAELTKKRNEERAKIKAEEDRLHELKVEAAKLIAQVEAERKAVDEVVNMVFTLNHKVILAFHDRNDFLTQHVYPHLIDDEGKLRSQITFMNSDQTRKVVALVNSITRMDPDLAGRARQLVDKFFDQFTEKAEMDQPTMALFDLTRNILVEKTQFKVGPDLYRFLGLEIKEQLFPELYQAQMLLRQSMRSEKTDKYVRLYVRESAEHSWEQVSLS